MRLQDVEGYTPITQQSIDGVKCTRIIYGEGSDKYNKYIQKLAKKVLEISYNRIDGYRHDEIGILARLDGSYESQPIYGYWDEDLETSVIDVIHNVEYNFLLDNSDEQSLVFIHNHPNNSEISINDAFECITEREIKCVVAVGNRGSLRYLIKTSKNFEDTRIKVIKAFRFGKSKEEIYKSIVNNPIKYYVDIR